MSRAELAGHDRDVFSLMSELLLALLAGAFLVQDLTELSLDGRWVAPVVLLMIGVVGLLATLRSAGARSAQ